jgi:hypothetical protein
LVGRVQLDHHLAVRSDIERVDRRLDDVLGQSNAGVGLQSPFDRTLRLRDVRRADRCGCHCPGRSHAGLLEKLTLVDLAGFVHLT